MLAGRSPRSATPQSAARAPGRSERKLHAAPPAAAPNARASDRKRLCASARSAKRTKGTPTRTNAGAVSRRRLPAGHEEEDDRDDRHRPGGKSRRGNGRHLVERAELGDRRQPRIPRAEEPGRRGEGGPRTGARRQHGRDARDDACGRREVRVLRKAAPRREAERQKPAPRRADREDKNVGRPEPPWVGRVRLDAEGREEREGEGREAEAEREARQGAPGRCDEVVRSDGSRRDARGEDETREEPEREKDAAGPEERGEPRVSETGPRAPLAPHDRPGEEDEEKRREHLGQVVVDLAEGAAPRNARRQREEPRGGGAAPRSAGPPREGGRGEDGEGHFGRGECCGERQAAARRGRGGAAEARQEGERGVVKGRPEGAATIGEVLVRVEDGGRSFPSAIVRSTRCAWNFASGSSKRPSGSSITVPYRWNATRSAKRLAAESCSAYQPRRRGGESTAPEGSPLAGEGLRRAAVTRGSRLRKDLWTPVRRRHLTFVSFPSARVVQLPFSSAISHRI